jgi:anti-sigma factor RsiW
MTDNGTQLSCQQLVELVTAYLEGRLDPGREGALDAHLELCGGCEAYVEQMRQTVIALRRLGEDGEEISAKTRQAVLEAFVQARAAG